ncbi:MAG: replicative DNA helicase [Prevotella sp.]|nr:replicative DNA helicase [Prevotella sp.]MBQ4294419.1 replicative DNA helicase [Prevotella sp.]
MPNNSNSNNNQRRVASAKTPTFDPGLGHLPPQSVETERLVLGALMVDKDAFTVVSEILRPETFYEPRNQKVFAAIQTLSINENPVDIITVTEQLKRDGTLEEVGGQMYVYDLTAHVASSAHVEYHSRILAQKYLARQLITFASQIETLAFDEGNDIELVMQEAEGKLFELSQKNMRQDYTQIDPVVKSALDIMQRAASNAGGLTGVSSGYTKLDDMTSGWQKSDLVILAGRPAMGKTSFALSIAKNVAVDNRVPTAFFSLEMSNIQLVNRLISNTCEIDSKKVMNGQLDDAEWRRLDTNIRKLEGAPLYLDDTPGLSIFELRTKARRLVREKKVEIIMIDYLQLMNANGMRFGNRQEEVSTISRSLKSLAKELDIPIIALSQLNRSVEQRDNEGGKRPQLSDLRESGAIEQDADMVLFVHRPEYYHIYHDENGNDLRGMAQIIIAKHRKGAVGDVLLHFRGQYTRFDNPEDSYVPPTAGGEIIGSKLNNMPDDPLGPSSPGEAPF